MIAELATKSQKLNENKTQPQQKAKSINKRQNGMTKEKLMNVMTTTNSSSITTKYEKKKILKTLNKRAYKSNVFAIFVANTGYSPAATSSVFMCVCGFIFIKKINIENSWWVETWQLITRQIYICVSSGKENI